MSIKFNIGDKVRCIDDSNSEGSGLVFGHIYTVYNTSTDDGDEYLHLNNDKLLEGMFAHRFIHDPSFIRQQKLQEIDNSID